MTKLTEKVQDKKETLSELDAQEATLKRALTSKREKLSKLTMQHEIRVKDLKVTIEAMSRQVTFVTSYYFKSRYVIRSTGYQDIGLLHYCLCNK